MRITRRDAGALALGTLLLPHFARAATPGMLVRSDGQPQNLDPHQVLDVPMLGYSLNTYDGLYRYENNPPELRPWLAQGHDASADGLTWTFRLRQGAHFHDGSEITADDVVYSFRRVLALGKSPASAFLAILKPERVTATDKYTVQFQLERPYGPFLSAIPIVNIVNPRVLRPMEKSDDWGARWLASNEAGSGAYRLDPASYVPIERLDLHRFEDHFLGWSDNPKPVQTVAFRLAHETTTGVLGLLNGSIDMTDSYLPTDQVEQVQASKAARVEKNVSLRTFIVRMNNAKPPFNNPNARKCFAHAFNYTGFIQDILKGYAQRDPTPLPTTLWGCPADAAGYEYDLDKAKFFFKQALADGAPMHRPIEIHTLSTLEQTNQAAQLFQSDLATVGINAKIISDTWANITTNTTHPESTPDMWIHWVSTYFVDPENWVGQMYDSQFAGTWKASSWYKNPEVDALLRRARDLVKQEDRAPLYEQATRRVMADCVDIWVYNTVELRGVSRRVTGDRFCPVGSGGEMRWVQLA